MIIDENFFIQTHSFFKDVSKEYLLPNLGNLENDEISEKIDNSLVTKYDLIIENELIQFFKEKSFLISFLKKIILIFLNMNNI
jgi:fructose-1,6-bisphosphatase/inositol monophosphatase family enzyme